MQEGIKFEALDNGVLSCANPKRLQQLCDGLSGAKIEALLSKWLARLPHPFTAQDRAAGYRYAVSILQAEFSLTQVLDRPLTGRVGLANLKMACCRARIGGKKVAEIHEMATS